MPRSGTAMNKSDLTKTLSKELDLPLRKAEEIVDVIFGTMSQALTERDRIEIRGFGSFTVREYGGYSGRNPKTGKEVVVKPKGLPFFKVGKELADRLKDG
jgi:integration host factor subunit beta